MRPVLASRNSPWRARRLSGWLVGLAVSLAACNGKPARKAPRVNRLARETWAATHLEVSRRELLPRTVVARPDALVWRVSAGQFAADPSGAVRFAGPGVAETVAAVTLSPAVAYSLRARGEGGLAVESRSALGNRQSVWEEATKQRVPPVSNSSRSFLWARTGWTSGSGPQGRGHCTISDRRAARAQ